MLEQVDYSAGSELIVNVTSRLLQVDSLKNILGGLHILRRNISLLNITEKYIFLLTLPHRQ
jgi:hypothetical protein